MLRLDASGVGTLCVALAVRSESLALVGLIQVGSTLYFELPVQMAADWSALRLVADRSTPGHLITPTVPLALLAADTLSRPRIALDRCADEDGNGIHDGADERINAIRSQLKCTAQH